MSESVYVLMAADGVCDVCTVAGRPCGGVAGHLRHGPLSRLPGGDVADRAAVELGLDQAALQDEEVAWMAGYTELGKIIVRFDVIARGRQVHLAPTDPADPELTLGEVRISKAEARRWIRTAHHAGRGMRVDARTWEGVPMLVLTATPSRNPTEERPA